MTQSEYDDLKTEYATTDISYRKIAAKYGISYSTLSQMAAKENWTEARREYRNKVVSKTIAKAANMQASKLFSLMKSADKMSKVIEEVVKDSKQFNRHLVQTRTKGKEINTTTGELEFTEKWDVEERIYKKVDTKAIRDLTSSMKDLTAVIRNIYDIPTMAEKTAMDIAVERLKLEQAKSGDDGDDEETGIVLLPEVTPDE